MLSGLILPLTIQQSRNKKELTCEQQKERAETFVKNMLNFGKYNGNIYLQFRKFYRNYSALIKGYYIGFLSKGGVFLFINGGVSSKQLYPTFFNKVRQSPNIYYGTNRSSLIERDSSTKPNVQRVKDINTIIDFAADYYSHFGKLRETAKGLTSANANSIFEHRAVEVAHPHIFQAKADSGALTRIYDVSVEKLGVAQKVRTGYFKRDKLVVEEFDDIKKGNYQFKIVQDGGREDIFTIEIKDSVEIIKNEKNEDVKKDHATFYGVFKQIADKINESSLGISVRYGRESGLSTNMRMVLTADEPGTSSAFTIQDIPGKDGVGFIDQLGMEVVREAEDVVLNIEGIEKHNYFSMGDKVFLINDNNVILDLKGTGQTYFAVTRDIKGIRDRIEQFTDAYGKAFNFMKQTKTNGELEQLMDRLADIVRNESKSLKSIGINVDKEGKLRIDKEVFTGLLEKKLEEEFDLVEEIFGGFHGIATSVERLSGEALKMTPLRFMNEPREVDFLGYIKNSYDMLGQSLKHQFIRHQGMVLDMML